MDTNASTGTVDPNSRPMVQATSKQKPINTKKMGIIIGAVVACVVILVGIIVAVILAKSSQKTDVFGTAMQKLFDGNEDKNVKTNGNIKLSFLSPSSSISEIDFNIDGQHAGASSTNDFKVSANVELDGGQTINPEVEFITTESKDIFLKLGGLALSLSKIAGSPYESFPKDDPIVKFVDEVDGQWLMSSSDEMKEFLSSENSGAVQVDEKSMVCVSNLASDLGQNTYRLMEIYKKHPFVGSTQEDITITKKTNPIYKVTVDRDNFVAFLEEFKGTEPITNFLSCAGANQFSITDEIVDGLLSILPDVYVEIDNNYEITRVYSKIAVDGLNFELEADIDYSYPSTINIAEPTEYKDFSEVFEEFMSSMSAIMQEAES